MDRQNFIAAAGTGATLLRPDAAQHLEAALHRLGAASPALGAMRIDGVGAAALVDYLIKKHLIHVRARFVPGEWEGIRVTPNGFTTIEEVDRLSSAIRQAAVKGI